MTTARLFTVFLIISLGSCGQTSPKPKHDPQVIALYRKAIALVPYIDNSDSSRKALSFLDEATNIDSNFYLAYYNKLMFIYQLRLYDKGIATINRLIQ